MSALPPLTYPLDALVSFHYYRQDKTMEPLVATRRLRMIGDSGAFSAFTQGTPIQMVEYVAWCRQWSPYLYWTAALDVIGDPQATLRNWRTMRDRHGLTTVPTLHVGTDPRWLEPYVADGVDFFGLGGMVGRALPSLPWVVSVFRYARDRHPQVRFHIWGITNRRFLDNLPAYSADSSGIFGASYRYAALRLFDPRNAKHATVLMKGVNTHKLGSLLRDIYRVDPAIITRPGPHNRDLLIRLAASSAQLYGRWLQQRHRVPAPTWAVQEPQHLHPDQPQATVDTDGIRVHMVSAAAGGTTDDLVTAVGLKPQAGTRVHCVDGNHENLLKAASVKEEQ